MYYEDKSDFVKDFMRAIAFFSYTILCLSVGGFIGKTIFSTHTVEKAPETPISAPQEIITEEIPITCTTDNGQMTVNGVICSTSDLNEVSDGEGIKVQATWYSRDGCINCHPDLIMANGEPLDDDAKTIAYDDAVLNSFAELCNRSKCLNVKITDRIGISGHVDLTPAVFREFAPLSLGIMDLVIYPKE